jgi:hypothetical protein
VTERWKKGKDMGDPKRVQAIQNRLRTAKESATRLSEFITDKQAGDHLLGLSINLLGDVEGFLLPNGEKTDTSANADLWYAAAESALHIAEEQIRRVNDLANKYGRNLTIVGGDSGGSRFVLERGIMRRR